MDVEAPRGLLRRFDEVEDPRVERTKLHRLPDILVITLCAVTCGADSWTEIELFGKAKFDWLRCASRKHRARCRISSYSVASRGLLGYARGRSVTPLDPYAMHLLRRHDMIPWDSLGEIAEGIGPGAMKRWRLAFWVGVVLVLIFLVTVVIRKCVMRGGLRLDSVERVLWPLILMLFSFAVGRMWRSARQCRSKRVESVMLKHLRCPHCGYDLGVLLADPQDGATVCPECGCAWRLGQTETAGDRGDG